jgi:hypothetical protein
MDVSSFDFGGINNGNTLKRPGYDLARLHENQARYLFYFIKRKNQMHLMI